MHIPVTGSRLAHLADQSERVIGRFRDLGMGDGPLALPFRHSRAGGRNSRADRRCPVDVRRGETCWQLWSGPKLIKDLGNSEAEAREVVSVIRQLRLTQRGTIGTRGPVMEYWLSDGHAPIGAIPAYRLLPLDRSTLRVEQLGGHWCLRDDRRLWFNFGIHEKDARHSLEVIQRHEFNRIGYVGQAETVMIYFLKNTPERTAPRSRSPRWCCHRWMRSTPAS